MTTMRLAVLTVKKRWETITVMVPVRSSALATRANQSNAGTEPRSPEPTRSTTLRSAGMRVHLALHNTNPNPLVEGPTLVLASVHAKTRRAGYRNSAGRWEPHQDCRPELGRRPLGSDPTRSRDDEHPAGVVGRRPARGPRVLRGRVRRHRPSPGGGRRGHRRSARRERRSVLGGGHLIDDEAVEPSRNRRRHWPDASGGRESRRGCSPGGGRRRDAIVSRARRARLAPRSDRRPLRPRMGDRRASGNLATALSGLWRRPDGEGGPGLSEGWRPRDRLFVLSGSL